MEYSKDTSQQAVEALFDVTDATPFPRGSDGGGEVGTSGSDIGPARFMVASTIEYPAA